MHDDTDLERLLTRYRPAAPAPSLEERLVLHSSRRGWPWAVAAALLLATTIATDGPILLTHAPAVDVVDPQRVQAVTEALGGPETRPYAEWIVQQEARADREARIERANRESLTDFR